MKKIKSFNDFSLDQTNEEINLRNLAAGAAMAASTLLPGKALANNEPGDTLHKTTKSKSEMEIMTKYQHWTLDSTHVDTLYRKVKEEGKALIHADTLDLGVDGDLFLTGKFELNRNVSQSILDAISDITTKSGIITDFQIISSTDKEPIDMEYEGMTGNEALAHRRADAVNNELIKIGVDPSIISIEANKDNPDGNGPDIYKKDMGDEERKDARLKTKDFRCVKIRIVYIIKKDIPPLPAEIDTILKKTYYLSKPFVGGGQKPPRLKSHFKKTTISVPALKTNRDNGRTKCSRWDSEGFWNDKKLGYQ
jgi:outer membrane protein OmpA-like peptidoglycan-associated protein